MLPQKKSGIIAGCFDIIHPGYVEMFIRAKKHCNHLTIALHIDPTIERPEKCKPILSIFERYVLLNSIKYVDDVVMYKTEQDLNNLLKNYKYNVRILGDDYKDKYATGQEYADEVIYVDRSHGWSTTKYKKLIASSLKGK